MITFYDSVNTYQDLISIKTPILYETRFCIEHNCLYCYFNNKWFKITSIIPYNKLKHIRKSKIKHILNNE